MRVAASSVNRDSPDCERGLSTAQPAFERTLDRTEEIASAHPQ